MMDYQSLANSALMWIVCAVPIVIVLLECVLFFKKSRKLASDMEIDPKLIRSSMRSSAISAIGPCLVVVATVLSLISYVGTPLAWMRNSIIGNAQEELLAANFAADGMGINLNESLLNGTLNLEYLATAAFVMAAGMVGYCVTSALFSDKVELLSKKISGGNAALVPVVSLGAVAGAMTNIAVGQALPLSISTVGVLAGAALMAVFHFLKKKSNAVWLKEWSMTISIFGGMFIAYALSFV